MAEKKSSSPVESGGPLAEVGTFLTNIFWGGVIDIAKATANTVANVVTGGAAGEMFGPVKD
jgi:hypothetical protein